MPYATQYRLRFKEREDRTVTVTINDVSSFTPSLIDVAIWDLRPADQPFTISLIDNDQDKFNPIKAHACDIQFLSDTSFTARNFAVGNDNAFFVEAIVEDTNEKLFRGFLVMDGFEQPFLDPALNSVIKLRATDNLGTLNEQELRKTDNTIPKGRYKIIQFIAWCLQGTGLQLNINVTNSWAEESFQGLPAWNNIYLDSKTFENGIGKRVDRLEALKIILGYNCFIEQHRGEWWIRNVDEMTGSTVYHWIFDYLGVFQNEVAPETKNKTIGRNEAIQFIDKDALVTFSRPMKFVRLKFNYQPPQEIPDNVDFSRGTDWLSPISVDLSLYIKAYAHLSSFPSTGSFDLTYKANDTGLYYRWTGSAYLNIIGAAIPQGKGYEFEDWNLKKGNPDASLTPTTTAYIAKIFQYGDEKNRYVVLTNPTVASVDRSYMESTPIPVNRYDKFTTSVDFRFPTNIIFGGSTLYVIMAVRLQGDDGSNWWLGKRVVGGVLQAEQWFQSNSTWSNFSFSPGPAQQLQFNGTIDTTTWQTVLWDAPPCPVGGDLYLQLCAMNSQSNSLSLWDDTDIHYSNLQFTHMAYVNGSYQKYSGHSYKIEQAGNFKANVDAQVSLGDSPHGIFKGTMWKLMSGRWVRTQRWYASGDLRNQGINPPIDDAYLHPFGHLQIYAVWNQYSRRFVGLTGSVLGLQLGIVGGMPDGGYAYAIIASISVLETDHKRFMLVGFSLDTRSGKWKATLIESNDSVLGKDFTTPVIFNLEDGR